MKKKLSLVLSGGSVRAAAHVGVLRAMEEYNLQPDVIVGTSGGAIVAALYASGLSALELEKLFLEYSHMKGEIIDLNWRGAILALLTWDLKRINGVVRGRSLEQIIAQSLSIQRFQDLKKCQLLIPAVNLNNGQQTVFCDFQGLNLNLQDGEYADYPVRNDLTIAQAVRASISIPGIFVPAVFEDDPQGECYVDGALRDGYPVNIAVRLGRADQVIGVNLGYAGMRRDTILADGPLEIFSQSLDIMMRGQYRDRLQDRALIRSKILTLNPLIYDIGTFEVAYIPHMIARGYTIATRFFNEQGLIKGMKENQARLFSKMPNEQSFPAKGTAYFDYLLANQIKKHQPNPVTCKTSWIDQLKTRMTKKASI